MSIYLALTCGPIAPQDFRNGKVDTAFIPKHEQELAAVRIYCDLYTLAFLYVASSNAFP